MPGNAPLAGLVGGVVGGLTQAYAVMGVTTTMVGRSRMHELTGRKQSK